MRKSLFLLSAVCVTGAALALEASDPRIGVWVQQAGAGTSGAQQSFEDLGGGKIRLRLTGLTVELRCDGTKYPFMRPNGKAAGPTYACKVTGPRTVEYVYTQEGRDFWTTSTGVETVSEDGSTLMHIGVRRDAGGKVVENLRQEYKRRDKT